MLSTSSLGEVTSGFTCCCLPCLPKLCRHFTGRLKHYYSHQKSSGMHSVERAKSAALVPGAKRQSTYFELGGLPHDGQDLKKDDYSVDVRAIVWWLEVLMEFLGLRSGWGSIMRTRSWIYAGWKVGSVTYNKPNAKTDKTPSLRNGGSCRFQIVQRGKRNVAKSKIVLLIADIRVRRPRFTHCSGVAGIQIFLRGIHWSAADVVDATP